MSIVASRDFLDFSFSDRSYADQLARAHEKTGSLAGVRAHVKTLASGQRVVWCAHDFGFLGGSLGCAEGEILARGLELALEQKIPAVIECRSGGARMQEGTLSLMQMAKVSVVVQALKASSLPLITLLRDPTYGGVAAAYAMQGDVRISVKGARIGFAGPQVILNTVFGQDQGAYDAACPPGFQSAEYVHSHGQVDLLVTDDAQLTDTVSRVLGLLYRPAQTSSLASAVPALEAASRAITAAPSADGDAGARATPNFLKSRGLDRVQTMDIVDRVFDDFVELRGDGAQGADVCLRGGLASFAGTSVVVIALRKGHDPNAMREANYGMPSPAGYRTALRLMRLAERFHFPVVTLIDTPGAYPSFASEAEGQSEAIATNLLAMAGLDVPIVSIVVGEGGSGGALAVGMGNHIAMLSQAYYSVISPEGGASILGKYASDEEKAALLGRDAAALASVQRVYAHQLKELGVIDEVLEETEGETAANWPVLEARVRSFLATSLADLCGRSSTVLRADRYRKFRRMGKFRLATKEEVAMVEELRATTKPANGAKGPRAGVPDKMRLTSRTLSYVADRVLNSANSTFRGTAPPLLLKPAPPPLSSLPTPTKSRPSLKAMLDLEGPEAVSRYVARESPKRLFVTDTSMRDAHQSILATRVRTTDLLAVADVTNHLLRDAFSLEVWGGATFDVSWRFLHESPWHRLALIREACPDVMLQMLLRGSNAVGYTNYPDNVVSEFVRLAARAGIDVFRIFDCFNQLDAMQLSIDAVRKAGKIAEVCICFTGNFLSADEDIYTLDYFKDLARRIDAAGAHMIAIKDMAGLMKPQMAAPFVAAVRSVTKLPLHFHTHNTSSASLATALEMARAGCDVVDGCMASMADTTSQPSLNALIASTEGAARDTGIDYLTLEPLDGVWSRIRTLYAPFESGLRAGTARVYDHQIPGGQYSNLIAQSQSLGTFDRWADTVDMYRDVNRLFGDIVKVTPSSKVVGDMALYLIGRGLTTDDVRGEVGDSLDYPASVVALFRGELGTPHHGLPEDLRRKVLKGEKPLDGRAGASLPAVDLAAERERLEAKYLRELTEEEVISCVLYPAVMDKYFAFLERYGPKTPFLPSNVFFYGLKIGETFEVRVPVPVVQSVTAAEEEAAAGDAVPRSPTPQMPTPSITSEVKRYTVTLSRVGPLQEGGMRTLVFDVNGERREAVVKDESVQMAGSDLPAADPADPRQLGSPLPGTIERIVVAAGAEVAQNDVLLVVSAMKMEVQVRAPFDGTMSRLDVAVGDKVDTGTLLGIVAPDDVKVAEAQRSTKSAQEKF